MNCHYCGNQNSNRSKYCASCGNRKEGKKKKWVWFILLAFSMIGVLSLSVHLFLKCQIDNQKLVGKVAEKEIRLAEKEIKNKKDPEYLIPTPKPVTDIKVDTQREVSEIIAESLEKVVTIFTENNQGTGFMINNQGDILTNAHVTEGSVSVTVIDHTSKYYNGKVIGYSTSHDIAVIRIPELADHQAMELETDGYASIGEEVIALGSPMGNTNTATLGSIAAVNRSFYIGERIYENIYQMTALISPGSSGGPLLSVKTGKVIGINSARSLEDESIGFSIPLKDVYSIISGWITKPLSEQEIRELFFKNNGEFHFEEENEKMEEGYFEGGVSADEPGVYYEIPESWYEKDQETNREENTGNMNNDMGENVSEKDQKEDVSKASDIDQTMELHEEVQ